MISGSKLYCCGTSSDFFFKLVLSEFLVYKSKNYILFDL